MDEMVEVRVLLKPQTQSDQTGSQEIEACRTRLANTLDQLERLVAPEVFTRVNIMQKDLSEFAVHVSLVGQIKAGKTALANSLIGVEGLLPSDVNPWTSVVTSVHVNTEKPKGKDAVFTFFNSEEWSQMVNVGGHLGEMAMRTDSDEEIVELRAQIQGFQDRTKARLGKNFDFLLDGYHSFLGHTPDLVKKYVCLGDEDSTLEGRYADITKSADLYIDNKHFGLPTILCDTPGVNDPFLLREAVTLNNVTDTDICVIVLSAHQAFSSADIALLRILMALKHEQIILFVNRIDELQDPDRQVEEIDTYIRELLEEQSLPKDLPIVFGSAAWAEGTLCDEPTEMFEPSMPALFDFADARMDSVAGIKPIDAAKVMPGSTISTLTKTSDFSGLHDLQHIIEKKSAQFVSRPFLETLRQKALDIAEQSLLYLAELSKSHSSVRNDIDFPQFYDDLDVMLAEANNVCLDITKEHSNKVVLLVSAAFREFLMREKAGLKAHLANKKPIEDWKPDTDALRRELNLAHDEFVEVAPKRIERVFLDVSAKTDMIYATILDNDDDIFAVRVPPVVEPKTPVSLMRTMSIDMGTGWFSSWFNNRFNKATYLKKFEELSLAEMHKTLKDMQNTYVAQYDKQVRAVLAAYLGEHLETLQKLCGLNDEVARAEVKRKLGVDTEIRERQAELASVVDDLKSLFEDPLVSKSSTTKTVE